MHHLIIDPHSTGHVQQQQTQQQHSTPIANMALTADRETYLRLANHSIERSEQISQNPRIRSSEYYGGYVRNSNPHGPEQIRPNFNNGYHHPPSHYHLQSQSSSHSTQQFSDTNLYIKNLSAEFSDQDLAKLVEGCGKVKSMKAIIDKQTNKCKGFGFIDFETTEDAKMAIAKLQNLGYVAQLAKSTQQQEQDTTNLYFANLDPNMTEQDLKDALGEFGTVISVRILRNPDNKVSRGVGFARMNDKEQCQAIINRFHNRNFEGFSDKQVHVKFADANNKNKKGHKPMFDEMKNGHPLYPIDQAISYPASAVLVPQWPLTGAPILSPPCPNPGQQGPPPQPAILSGPPPHPYHAHHQPLHHHPTQIRPPIGVFNPAIPSYVHMPHGPGSEAATLVMSMQQFQHLQISSPPPTAYCLLNSSHPHGHPHGPTLYMGAPQPAPPPQTQSQPPQSATPATAPHDPSMAVSQELS